MNDFSDWIMGNFTKWLFPILCIFLNKFKGDLIEFLPNKTLK